MRVLFFASGREVERHVRKPPEIFSVQCSHFPQYLVGFEIVPLFLAAGFQLGYFERAGI